MIRKLIVPGDKKLVEKRFGVEVTSGTLPKLLTPPARKVVRTGYGAGLRCGGCDLNIDDLLTLTLSHSLVA